MAGARLGTIQRQLREITPLSSGAHCFQGSSFSVWHLHRFGASYLLFTVPRQSKTLLCSVVDSQIILAIRITIS